MPEMNQTPDYDPNQQPPESTEERRAKQLGMLNVLPAFEIEGGDDAHMLVELTDETVARLNSVGIHRREAERYGDSEQFCKLAFAFDTNLATDVDNHGFFVFEPEHLFERLGNRTLAQFIREIESALQEDGDTGVHTDMTLKEYAVSQYGNPTV